MTDTQGRVSEATPAGSRRGRDGAKSENAFRTISEVSTELGVPQHVLRFWETKFSQIRPLKRGGGRRYYRPEDIDLLRRIQTLLHQDGYTIKGVQKLLKGGRDALIEAEHGTEGGNGADAHAEDDADDPRLRPDQEAELSAALEELRALRDSLGEAIAWADDHDTE